MHTSDSSHKSITVKPGDTKTIINLVVPPNYNYIVKEIQIVPSKQSDLSAKLYINNTLKDASIVNSNGTILFTNGFIATGLTKIEIKVINNDSEDLDPVEVNCMIFYNTDIFGSTTRRQALKNSILRKQGR